ncbi:MAG: hypothetical protein Q9224_000584 [Gallowayella concinna]
MPKRSIADFFKPFAHPRHNQPSPDHDGSEHPRPAQRSRSNTPQPNTHSLPEPPTANNPIAITSSQSSLLSSLPDSSPNEPAESLNLPSELPTVQVDTIAPARSFVEELGGSQTAILPSSQRVVRNGEVVIKDSDDDRSDSDVSLEDLDDLIASRRPPIASSPPSPDALSSFQPLSSAHSRGVKDGTRSRSSKSGSTLPKGLSSTETKLPTYKFSLAALIKQSQNDENSRTSRQDAKHLIESLDQQKPVARATANVELDKDLLASVIRDDEDGTDLGRLMAAIERTEALQQEEAWSFFDRNREVVDVEPADCPLVPDHHWQSIFEDPPTRQQAFLSGYVGECASLRQLPDELLIWLLDAASHEERNDLRFSYCQTLQDLGDRVAGCLTPDKVDKLFECVGARPEALDLGKPAVLSVATSKRK